MRYRCLYRYLCARMQKVGVILLFLALSIQLVAKLGVVAMYQANKDYIAKNLCENRAKPQMKCHGKCYLKKQLKQTDERENSGNPFSKSEQVQLSVFVLPASFTQQLVDHLSAVLIHNTSYRAISGINPLKDIFHPPQSTC